MTQSTTKQKVKKWPERIARAGMTHKQFCEEHASMWPQHLTAILTGKRNPKLLTVMKVEGALEKLGV